ncbi:MAG: DUF4861 domain-containing protein [Candidatus Azobacteroides sp.]|nr:DUF4861 domain-containing protein [Candidatus Azobacteroides sp.]
MKKIFPVILICILFTACNENKTIKVFIKNDSSIDRENEIIELEWSDITAKTALADTARIIVIDANGMQVPYQLVTEGNATPQKLIFPVSVKAEKSAEYLIKKGIPQNFTAKTFGRFVPERKDDVAWENDKIAFRMYGPALIAIDGPSNGIDVWVKKTENLIIDKWYKDDLSGVASYHVDHGEGVDCYKVGRTLGAGGMAPFVNDSLWLSENFVTQKVLDNGPLRTTIELTYKAFDVAGDSTIAETKIISLDAGSNFNKIIENYSGVKSVIPVAAGIILKTANAAPVNDVKEADPAYKPVSEAEKGFIAYAETADKADPQDDNGIVYTAVVFSGALKKTETAQKHVLAVTDYNPGENLVYYAGAGWSKGGFATEKEWYDYVEKFAAKLRSPLTIIIQ